MLVGLTDADHGPADLNPSAHRCANGCPDGGTDPDLHSAAGAHSDPCADLGAGSDGDS